MFDFVPFAGAGRKMADGKTQAGFIGQSLQFPLPEPQPRSIAAASVGRDQDQAGVRIQFLAFMAPPPTKRRHRKSSGVMVGPHVDKAGVPSHIVDAMGIGAGNGSAK